MGINQFLRETKMEMRNVIWPSRIKALIYAVVVIILSAAIGYFLGAFDTVFRAGLRDALF